jgi:hypothetical protein
MHSHISIELLKTLNNDELNKFSDFVRSPYFNKREAVIKLFDLISKHAPDYTNTALKKENLYKKLFPGKPYNEQTLRSRMSELSALIKEFIIQNRFEAQSFDRKEYYIKELLKRKKFELAEKQIKEGLSASDAEEKFDQDLLMEKQRLLTQYTKLLNTVDSKNEALELSYDISEISIDYFLIDLFKSYANILCREVEVKESSRFNYLKEFFKNVNAEEYIKTLKEKNYKHYPVIAINYFASLSMLSPENEEHFYSVKQLVFDYHEKFANEELYNYWTMLSNSAYVNYLSKGKKFLAEGHEINKFFIDKKLYDDTKPFSVTGYQNILTNALLVNDLDWGEKFVEEFKDKLPHEVISNRYNYCKAIIYFQRKKFNESIEYLSKVEPVDWDLKINVRFYYLQNYYELNMGEQVFSLIDTFRHYASNNVDKTPEYMEERVKNSLKFIGKMSNAKFGGKKLDYAIYKETEETQNILYKKWILEKMKALI